MIGRQRTPFRFFAKKLKEKRYLFSPFCNFKMYFIVLLPTFTQESMEMTTFLFSVICSIVGETPEKKGGRLGV